MARNDFRTALKNLSINELKDKMIYFQSRKDWAFIHDIDHVYVENRNKIDYVANKILKLKGFETIK